MAVNYSFLRRQHPKARNAGHTRARPLSGSLEQPGRVRVANWLALLNIGHSAFYERRKTNSIPCADGHDPRPFWDTKTVRDYLALSGRAK